MEKPIDLHPFLFAAYPALHLYSVNIGKVFFVDTLPAFGIILTCTTFFYLIGWLVFKDRAKSAIAISLFLILFFSYGPVLHTLNASRLFSFRHRELLFIWFLLFCGGTFFIGRSKSLRSFSKILNITAFFSVSVILISIAVCFCGEKQAFEGDGPNNGYLKSAGVGLSTMPPFVKDPDIYCIILDEYAGLDQISEVYGYDNSAFAKRLIDKGFYIAAKSRIQSEDSDASIASLLNMDLPQDKVSLRYLRDNKVVRILKGRGYKYIHIGSWYYALSQNENADINYNGFALKNEFNVLLLNSTAYSPFITQGGLYRGGIFYNLAKLEETAGLKGPKFVFAHIICPHTPFIFDRDGKRLPPWQVTNYKDKSVYLGQYIFITKKVEETIDAILAKSEKPPVIIIQSDHGVRNQPGLNAGDARRIFNAYYLPGEEASLSNHIAAEQFSTGL